MKDVEYRLQEVTGMLDRMGVPYTVDRCPSDDLIKEFKSMSAVKMIVSNGNMAVFKEAVAGVLYYVVHVAVDCCYQFPVDMNDRDDVGTSTFPASIKAITLMRYIRKAEADGTLINVGALHSEPGKAGEPGFAGIH